jgi:uncharacterized protein (DUF1015 family)
MDELDLSYHPPDHAADYHRRLFLPQIRPFAGVHFSKSLGPDWSALIAPPFDVLDEKSKAALQAKHPNNIVSIDLPYLPPKAVGPDEVYSNANFVMQQWLKAGTLQKFPRQAIYPYTQSFDHNGRMYHRRGFFCTVKISPFGEGHVVPHEKTYREAIEDRLKLMRATKTQMSPIFGLYSDSRHEATNLLYKNLSRPEFTATLNGVKNDLWTVHDTDIERQIMDFIGRKPVYIADGHHRYTTALTYLQELEKKNGGPLPPNHPANYCMFVLVGMQDDGLLILPTHRLIGNVEAFNIEAFIAAVAGTFDVTESAVTPDKLADYIDVFLPKQPAHTFGLYDGRSKKLYQLTCRNQDVLESLEPNLSDASRRLDVAILQRYLLDEIIQPNFAGAGKEITKQYTAESTEVVAKTDGVKSQIAFLLKSTPLGALEQLGQHNEVMPQKSTYFFPKLATGMVMNSVA